MEEGAEEPVDGVGSDDGLEDSAKNPRKQKQLATPSEPPICDESVLEPDSSATHPADIEPMIEERRTTRERVVYACTQSDRSPHR
jgi:hypothetical protein